MVLALACMGCIGQAPQMEWQTDPQAALDKAKAENKSILFFFYDAGQTVIIGDESANPSEWMEKNTFSKADVAKILKEKFVIVRLDIGIEKNKELATTYGGKVFPFYIVVSANGDVCRTFSGVMDVDSFLKKIEGCYS
jgi:thioredoxin-related protein